MQPRPYQTDAINAIRAAQARGVDRQLVVMATGLGKTAVVTMDARRAREESEGFSALMLVHRMELLEQAVSAFRRSGFESVGQVCAGGDSTFGREVTVAMVDTLAANPAKLARVASRDYHRVICDEAHLSLGPKKWKSVLDELTWKMLLGITATPGRPDGVEMRTLYDECVYQMTLLDGVRGGWLSYLDCKAGDIDVDLPASQGGDFKQSALSKQMRLPEVVAACVKEIMENCTGRKSIVFCVDRQHCKDLAAALCSRGMRFLSIDEKSSTDARRDALCQLAAGEIDGVCNCMVFTAGTDVREVDCIVWARPTQSQVLYIQGTGRCSRLIGEEPCTEDMLRPDPEGTLRYVQHLRGPGSHGYMQRKGGLWVPVEGKRRCLVLDLVKNTDRHHLVQLAALGGRELLPPEEREKREAKDRATKAEEEQREAGAAEVRRLRNVDLMAPPKSGELPWGESPYGWGLRLGHDKTGRHLGHIICRLIDREDPDKGWNVVHIEPQSSGPPIWELLNPNRVPMARDWAFGLAEQTARRLGASRSPDGRIESIDVTPSSPVELHLLIGAIVDEEKSAEQQFAARGLKLSRPASERATQAEMGKLRELGVEVPAGLTHAQAVRLTRQAYARGAHRRRA